MLVNGPKAVLDGRLLLAGGRGCGLGGWFFLRLRADFVLGGFLAATDDGTRDIYLGGLVAGAIGAAGTILGGAITLSALRRWQDWLLTICIGAVAGLLVGFDERILGASFLPLFLFWQAAVAGCIGYALTRRYRA